MNIHSIQKIVEKDGIVFLTYGGFLSQTLIAGMTEALEKEAAENELGLNESTNIFTIFIELAQNMMNYSKSKHETLISHNSEGIILVGKVPHQKNYYVLSQNIVTAEDKEKMLPKLLEITSMDQNAIKQRYRELRKSGKGLHHKGGGIGFYEIAKRSDKITYEFEQISENRYYFRFKAIINIEGKELHE